MLKKVLFIDRDGTLALEPKNYQLDDFSKLSFYPKVFTYLGKIAKELDYELVMVTNQDGLGTDSFPEDTFWPVQNFLIESFQNEGIVFSEVLIDRSLPEDNASTRKPRTGMLTNYLDASQYDLKNSFVIGDRLTDIELAQNIGAKGILISNDTTLGASETSGASSKDSLFVSTAEWEAIYNFLKLQNQIQKVVLDFPLITICLVLARRKRKKI